MKKLLPFATVGLIAGLITSVIVGVVWPAIFPGIIRNEHYYGIGPSLPVLMLINAAVVAPFALLAGIVGSRIAVEGGEGEQKLLAAIAGIIAAAPLACYGLWQFSGW